jgi:trk system potassium uptake protein TrkH
MLPSYTDAYFEAMSGFTTTGATVLTDIEGQPLALHFWRSFMQWLGGMGIIVLSLAVLPMLGVGGMQLYKAEVPGPASGWGAWE